MPVMVTMRPLVKGLTSSPPCTACPTSSAPTDSPPASWCPPPPSHRDTSVLVTVNNILATLKLSYWLRNAAWFAAYKIKCIKKFLAVIEFANNIADIEFSKFHRGLNQLSILILFDV